MVRSTQGLLTLTRNGKVILKAVCGCNGYNVKALAEAVKELEIVSVDEVYEAARDADFGCRDCRVVISDDEEKR